MKKKWPVIYSWVVAISDLALGLVAASVLWTFWFEYLGGDTGAQPYELQQKLLFPAFLLSSVLLHGGYRNTHKLNRLEQILGIYKSSMVSMVYVIVAVFLIKGYHYSRGFIALYFIFAPVFLSLGRILLFNMNMSMMSKGWGVIKAVIVGNGKSARAILDHLMDNRAYGYQIVGFFVDSKKDLDFNYRGIRAVGLYNQCSTAIIKMGVEEIFIPGLGGGMSDYRDMLELCRNHKIEVSIVSPRFDLLARVAGIYDVAGVAIISRHGPFYFKMYPAVKRTMDVVLSFIALLVFFPLMILIAILIKANSPGPVFYRQTRVGQGGKQYQLMKFRTMHTGADQIKRTLQTSNEADGPIFKIREDPRVTRTGRWLRRLSLDELPQLINVFKGEMSLVGPRPPLPSEVEHYQEWHKYRLNGPQGMTGLWQVSGRSELSFEEMVLLDIYYLEHWSPLMDLEIMVKTIPAVITAKGAY